MLVPLLVLQLAAAEPPAAPAPPPPGAGGSAAPPASAAPQAEVPLPDDAPLDRKELERQQAQLARELPPPAPVREQRVHWIGRLSGGFGPVMPSAQEQLLNKDGFSGGRWLAVLDVVGMPWRHWGLGGFVAGAVRNPDDTLSDHLDFVGAEAMLLAGHGSWQFPIVGRVGYAGGTESFNGKGRWQSAPLFGLEAGVLWLHFPVGLAAGALFAPAGAPGEQGEAWNMGSFYGLLVIHVEG